MALFLILKYGLFLEVVGCFKCYLRMPLPIKIDGVSALKEIVSVFFYVELAQLAMLPTSKCSMRLVVFYIIRTYLLVVVWTAYTFLNSAACNTHFAFSTLVRCASNSYLRLILLLRHEESPFSFWQSREKRVENNSLQKHRR